MDLGERFVVASIDAVSTCVFLAVAILVVCGKENALASAPRVAAAFIATYVVQISLEHLLLLSFGYLSPIAVFLALASHARIDPARALVATVLGFGGRALTLFLLFAAVVGSQ